MCAISNLGFPLAIGNTQICKRSHLLVKYEDEMVQLLGHVKSVFSQIAIFFVSIFRNNKFFCICTAKRGRLKTDCINDHLKKPLLCNAMC